jgi:diguanylate cyclase (GGDEF)-like protein
MRWKLEATLEALRWAIPWLVLAAALALTTAGWFALERSRVAAALVQFERRTETAVAAVRARMLSYEQVLRSGAARMASSPSVSRAEWHDFIAHLQLEERFPGIQALGYAQRVGDWERPAHVKRMRESGFPDYDIRPEGERPDYVVVVYSEPFAGRNVRFLGYDMLADPTRRDAMERARETADVAISGKVVLGGEMYRGAPAQQAGFVMYAPVYHDGFRVVSREDRRPTLAGYTFTPLRMHDLMSGLLDEGVLPVLDMRIHDSAEPLAENLLIDTRTAWRSAVDSATPKFRRAVSVPMPGRTWSIEFVSRPEFDAMLDTERPYGLLAAGIASSLIVFILTSALVYTWNRAHNRSMRDPLTGLYNRRYLEETMGREVPRARRLGESVGMIVLDLDHFKELNDTHGHDAGDHVLSRTGELLKHATRGGDIACRVGGEEFAIILPGASLEVARRRAEAIRTAFESTDFQFGGRLLGPLSLSAGVAALPPEAEDWVAALQRADRALYAAKQAGRNRVLPESGSDSHA